MEASGHLAFQSCTWVGMPITDINCIILILLVRSSKNVLPNHVAFSTFFDLFSAGNYSGWKATCIGNNSSAAVSILKQEYKEGEMTLDASLDLSMKVLSKTLDMTKLTSDKIEVATLKRVNGKTKIHILTTQEMDALIAKFEAKEKEAEEASRS